MGWYGKGILDGDEPMDYESDIDSICGCPNDYDGDPSDFINHDTLTKHQLDIYEHYKKIKSSVIAFQVLAVHMVTHGVTFDDKVLKKCKECLMKDSWKNNDVVRKYHIDYLLNVLENYKNEPTSYYDIYLDSDKYEKPSQHLKYIISKFDAIHNPPPFVLNKQIGYGSYKYHIVIELDDTTDEWVDFLENVTSFFDIPIVYIFKSSLDQS